MAKLDRLGWAAGLCFRAYGSDVGIRVGDPAVLGKLTPHLPPGSGPTPRPDVDRLYSLVAGGPGPRTGVRRYHILYADSTLVARVSTVDEALAAFERDVRTYLAETARRRIFVHAGVVGWRGWALVIPGRSHSGKSELVAALVRAGAAYLSDEYAVFDARGRVHPYPLPISLRRAGGEERRLSAADLGGTSAQAPLPVGLVALATYQAGALWRPRRLPPGRALLALLGHAIPARQRPAATLAALGRALQRATVLEGLRGEAGQVAPILLEALERLDPTAG